MEPPSHFTLKVVYKIGGVLSGDYDTVIIVSRYSITKGLDHALLGTPEVILKLEQ